MHGFAQVSARLRLVERGAARTGAKSGLAERNSGTWRRRRDSLQAFFRLEPRRNSTFCVCIRKFS